MCTLFLPAYIYGYEVRNRRSSVSSSSCLPKPSSDTQSPRCPSPVRSNLPLKPIDPITHSRPSSDLQLTSTNIRKLHKKCDNLFCKAHNAPQAVEGAYICVHCRKGTYRITAYEAELATQYSLYHQHQQLVERQSAQQESDAARYQYERAHPDAARRAERKTRRALEESHRRMADEALKREEELERRHEVEERRETREAKCRAKQELVAKCHQADTAHYARETERRAHHHHTRANPPSTRLATRST